VEVKPKLGHWLMLGAVLAIAAFLRLYRIESLPRGPYYDEAANGILAGEIATGKAYPLFIRSYTGKEVLYFYAAAGVMKVLGVRLLSLRLTSVLLGIATVGATYWLALELFADEGEWTRHAVGLIAAALTAVSFLHILLSRYGFRAISQPLLQALMLGTLWRALRRGGWGNVVLAGVFAGATAYTYLASRIVPVALLPWVGGAWIASRGERGRIAARIGAFALAAALVFAPLGAFFLRNPEAFGTRMGQVSVFSPEVNEGDLGGTLLRSIGAAFGMFTVRGDPQSRFGVIGRPVFDPVVGAFFYMGVLYALYRAIRGPRPHDRVLYGSLLVWVPLMLVPSILGVKEVPHSARAIGVIPVLFLFPALGIVGELRFLAGTVKGLGNALPLVSTLLAALLLVSGGIEAGRDYFVVWGNQAVPYYENDNDMADAAGTLNAMDTGEADLLVSSIHYRHPTMAFLANDYSRMRWLVGTDVLAFPPPEAKGAIYVFPHSATPDQALLDLLEPIAEGERYPGPDGQTAYRIYRLAPGQMPELTPQYSADAIFGGQIELLGYDLPPIAAGETLVATLYWRVLAPPNADDYLPFAHLQDAWGLQWGSTDPFDYPSSEWAPGQVIVQRLKIDVSPLTPPGEYTVLVGYGSRGKDARLPRLDEQGRVAGTTAALGPVSIALAAQPPTTLPSIQMPLEARFGGLALLGQRRDQRSLRPGDTYYLGLYWQAVEALPDLEIALTLVPTAGDGPVPLWRGEPAHGTYPTDGWAPGTVLLDQYGLRIPQDASAGDYDVTLTVHDRESGQQLGGAISLGALQIEAVDRKMVVPPIEHPLQANLGDQVELLGYDLDRTAVGPGGTLHLTLYWRALSEMETSYTVFTHLLDRTTQIRGQQDNPPVNGTYPTTLWVPGEVVADPYAIKVDADAPSGTHAIEIGLYVPETGQRLPVLDAAGQVTGDRILVSEVEVE
jgi:4-amino-4-deoxy-L-arabinose transferase-like glycosyltransferase